MSRTLDREARRERLAAEVEQALREKREERSLHDAVCRLDVAERSRNAKESERP